MSVMGSQLEIDMDPDGDLTVVPRHQGQTGTGLNNFVCIFNWNMLKLFQYYRMLSLTRSPHPRTKREKRHDLYLARRNSRCHRYLESASSR